MDGDELQTFSSQANTDLMATPDKAKTHFAALGYAPSDAPGEILAPGGPSRQEKREEKREAAKAEKRAGARAPAARGAARAGARAPAARGAARAGAPASAARAEMPRPMTSDEQSEVKKMLGKGGAGFRVDLA